MDAVTKMKYEHGAKIRQIVLKIGRCWPDIVKVIQEIKSQNCSFSLMNSSIIYKIGDYPFVMSFTQIEYQYVLVIQIGDARYELKIDPGQPDHMNDQLIVYGKDSLLAVGQENWYKVVVDCLERIDVYAPSA